MIYGYCRVSTNRQVITRQVENILKVYPGARIYQEAYTGVTSDRQEWKKLKKLVSSGDILVFDSVSRMSRNAEEGIQEYFELYNRGVKLIFLKESYINSDVYTKAKEQQIAAKTGNKITDILLAAIEEVLKVIAVDQIEKAFEQSEKEALDIRTRTREGLRVKKSQGVILGRRVGSKIQTKKSIKMKEKIKLLAKDFGGNLKDIQVIEVLKISRNTYFKYKRELKEEL